MLFGQVKQLRVLYGNRRTQSAPLALLRVLLHRYCVSVHWHLVLERTCQIELAGTLLLLTGRHSAGTAHSSVLSWQPMPWPRSLGSVEPAQYTHWNNPGTLSAPHVFAFCLPLPGILHGLR
jgi:hypothetical protein